jgi:hypothetical protein
MTGQMIFLRRDKMECSNRAIVSPQQRRGSATGLLVLLLVLVAVVFIVKWYMKEAKADPDVVHDLPPWKEWRLRQNGSREPGLPSAEQPTITDSLVYNGNLTEKDRTEVRGEIMYMVMPDGTVTGGWSGIYYKGRDVLIQVMGAEFEGHVYPSRMYVDANGLEDATKLYFMAKGDFLIQEGNSKKGTLFHRGGQIYVRGWVDAESASWGDVTITSDESYFETFEWKVLREGADWLPKGRL